MKQANPHLAARRAQKAALLPQVVQLAREGLSYQNIANQVGLAKSTVCQWLRGRPLEQAAKTLKISSGWSIPQGGKWGRGGEDNWKVALPSINMEHGCCSNQPGRRESNERESIMVRWLIVAVATAMLALEKVGNDVPLTENNNAIETLRK